MGSRQTHPPVTEHEDATMPAPIDKKPHVLYGRQIVLVETEQFRSWLDGLRDRKVRLRIDDRLRRLADGNAGDTKSVGDGVQELRLHFGPGYRVYYLWRDGILIILLCGGDKGSHACRCRAGSFSHRSSFAVGQAPAMLPGRAPA